MSPYLKSAGIVVIVVVLATAFQIWAVFRTITMTGSGGLAAVSFGLSEMVIEAAILLAVVWGFIYWRSRRARTAARR